MKENILILGAGVYQVPAIKKAKELGYNTIVLSYNIEEYPGSKIADICFDVDITDSSKVVEIARKYNVKAVFTTGSDVSLPALGKVNDELYLSGPSYEACILSTNKVLMKKEFQNKGVPTAKFQIVKNFEEAKKESLYIGYPIMVKAINSSGSRGIRKASSEQELKEAWEFAKKYSRDDDEILIEEFLEGIEFGAQAFIYDNEIKLICPHNDTTTSPPSCVPIGHSYPFENIELTAEIDTVVKNAIVALKLNNCAANIDLLLTKEGIKVFEIGARMGATCLPDLTEIYTGIDVVKECIKMALGFKPNFEPKQRQAVAALLITAEKSGIIRDIVVPDEIRGRSNLIKIDFDVEPGSQVNKFLIGPDRIGEIIVKADDWKSAETEAKKMLDEFIIKIE